MGAPMIRHWKKILWVVLLAPFVLLGVWLSRLNCGIDMNLGAPKGEPLRIAVLDPLCHQLAPDDLKDLRRDYAPLGSFLEETLKRRIELSFGNHRQNLLSPGSSVDLIIGRDAAVRAEAAQRREAVRPIARLTDDHGETDIAGLFLVRANDPAKTISDLADHTIVFGPAVEEERYAWALATLSQSGITPVPPLKIVATCRDALQALAQRKADAAVVSSYALGVVEGRGATEAGAFRVIGRTAAQPFIAAFATSRIGPSSERAITDALLSVQTHRPLLEALKSKAGFVSLQSKPEPKKDLPAPAPAPAPVAEWTDWRGPGRAGASPDVPAQLPSTVKILWKRGLTGAGLSGVAATAGRVIVADKSEQKDQDIWRCLDADTGQELWTIAYPTPQKMEFTNVPRATPVIHDSFVYLLGAFGDLHCVGLHGSGIAWRRDLIKDFGAKLPPWGTCSTPLVVGDSLIVNPGAADASLVALSLYTGEVLWKTPGAPSAYGSLILGTFGGVRQIVGYDAGSLGGWDPNTGHRLWTLLPDKKGDYNVPTPVNIEGRLLVATENNGTRLYGFDHNGQIRPVPVAQTRDLAPDTSTPVAIDGLVFGCWRGLFCLDLNDRLRTLYSTEGDGAFREYAAFIAGKGRVLAVTVGGEMVLFQAARDAFTPIGRLRVFEGAEVWSHPALVGNRLYIRSMNEICGLLLSDR
jgi:ABC-type phosphate/phosphonate transport system substrate-binding protein/outer membrane protein assembly factor BamB